MDRSEKSARLAGISGGMGRVSWLQLPELRPAGLRSATKAVQHIAGLLDGTDCDLVTVTLETVGRQRRYGLHGWTIGPRGIDIHPWGDPRHAEDAAQRARLVGHQLLDLFVDIARRWPKAAAPEMLGLVSDGTGLAFHGGHPCGTKPEWLKSHLSGRDPAAQIIPFAPDGAMAVLCGPANQN